MARPAPDDRDRLHVALGCDAVDLERSLFAPDSATRRVNREAVLLLGGGRALLLQVAHPLVAAGVAAHSRFRTHPLERLWRTLDLVLTIVFADAGRAIAAVRDIEHVHARVRGTLDADVGPFARGTPYDASDPRLLFWVHATLVDTALVVHERFVAPLTADDLSRYYEESKVVARLLGVPNALIPLTFDRFRAYMHDMLHGQTLTVGAAGHEVAASIMSPPLPVALRQGFRAAGFVTAGLLPAIVRQRYGLSWGPRREQALDALAAATRAALPFTPALLRFLPHARAAEARESARGLRRAAA